MKTPPEFKQYIGALCKFFRATVFAGEYDFHIQYVQEIPGSKNAYADINIDPVYLDADIRVANRVLELWKDKLYHRVAYVVCHEFCHILTEPLYEAALPAFNGSTSKALEDVRERQTQRICNSIMDLIPKSKLTPKGIECEISKH